MKFLTKSEYKKIVSTLTNLSNYRDPLLSWRSGFAHIQKLRAIYQYCGLRFGSSLGKPPFTDMNTENNQGVWLWKDEVTGFLYCYYSDCWKKSHYKGGTIECSAPISTSLRIVASGADRFLSELQKMSSFVPDENEMNEELKLCDDIENPEEIH